MARAVLFVMTDPDDETVRLMDEPKNNLGRIDLPTPTFRIDSARVADTAEGPVITGRVRWVGESERTVSEALEAAGETSETRTVTAEATDWLADWLTAHGGTDDSATIKQAGTEAGHSKSRLRHALKEAARRGRDKRLPAPQLLVTARSGPVAPQWGE